MRAAIYGRVSTDRQTHDSQLAELHEHAARRGWPAPAEFLDVASGGKRDRVSLDRLLKEVRRGRVDVILCFRLDRLARSLAHLAQIIEELQVHRVALVVPGQGIDTTAESPAARFQVAVLGAVAELERGMIVERVRAGLAVAKAKGTRLGRPSRVNDHQRAAVAELLAQGVGVRETGRQLKLPASTVRWVRDAQRNEDVRLSDEAASQGAKLLDEMEANRV